MIDYTKAPGKTLLLEELQNIYIAIVEKHGEKAYSCEWIQKSECRWLYVQVSRKYKIKWNDFRKQCGIHVELFKTKTLQDIVEEYKSIVVKYGEKAYRCQWMNENGYNWLYQQVRIKHKLSWNEFKKMCGVDRILMRIDLSLENLIEEYKSIVLEHGEKAYNILWMKENKNQWLCDQVRSKYNLSWDEFRRLCGFEFDNKFAKRIETLNDLIKKYKLVVGKYGEKAYSCEWMKRNGYGWIYDLCKRYTSSWREFKKLCGIFDIYRRNVSFEYLIDEYSRVIKTHGELSYRTKWLIGNGYGWIVSQIHERFNMSWKQFVQMCKPKVEVEFTW